MTLPLSGKLTEKENTSEEFAFVGEVCILIEGGSGQVELQRSVKGSNFTALTDSLGNKAVFDVNDDVGLNAEIVNKSSSAVYRLKATTVEAPINFIVCK